MLKDRFRGILLQLLSNMHGSIMILEIVLPQASIMLDHNK